jgi:hypothetical protein
VSLALSHCKFSFARLTISAFDLVTFPTRIRSVLNHLIGSLLLDIDYNNTYIRVLTLKLASLAADEAHYNHSYLILSRLDEIARLRCDACRQAFHTLFDIFAWSKR